MARSSRLLAAIWVIAAAFPAQAQYGQYGAPPSQNIPDRPVNSPEEAVPASPAEILRAASCLVGRDAAAANRLLATSPYSREERQEAVRTLRAAERCIRARGLATSPLLLRGALAEALYEAQFAQPVAAAAPPVAAAPLFRPEAAGDHRELAPAFALAECTAARLPAEVRALLAAEPGGAAEGAALQPLNAGFSQCVAPGTNLSLDRVSLRAMLAESLFRWSAVQRDGSASPWATQAAQ